MTDRPRENPDEWPGAPHAESASFHAQLNAALATKPSVAPPEGFAAATAALAQRLENIPARTLINRQRGIGWGLTATIGGLTLLLALMIRYALSAPSPIATVAEMTLCVEFLMLLLGFLHFRRVLR